MFKFTTVMFLSSLIALGALAHVAIADDAADALLPSLVRVEYTLQYDGGQEPRTPGWAERCPGCGRYHIQPGREYVDEERPMEAAGYLISSTRVVTGDFFLQDRFIESVKVRFGENAVTARPIAHAIDHYAMMLELDEPLEGAQPMTFDADAAPPYRSAHWQVSDARWTLEFRPLSMDATVTALDGSERFVPMPARGVIVGADGTPIGLGMNQKLPLDESWRGSPKGWEWIERDTLGALSESIESATAESIPRVELEFRPDRSTPSLDSYYWDDSDDDESVTESHALGVLVSEDTMLVLASLNSRMTARLERITVHFPGEERIGAEFVGSLEDYGALVIQLTEPRSRFMSLDRAPIQRHGQRLLVSEEIELRGQTRISRLGHLRIAGYDYGWRRHIYPDVAGDTENLFIFDQDGTLVALPVLRRQAEQEGRRFSRVRPTLTAAGQIAAVLDDLELHIDPANIPLSEEEQLRLAWIGIEMQALDGELARLYEVSDITDDGRTGGMISHVYEGSPAAEAGLEPGDLLLRIHTDRRPRPIDITGEEDPFAMWGGFPWEYYDEMPEDYFDQMPPPWPTADNAVNRALTDLGFGTPVEIEIYRDDETKRIEFTVEQSPSHHRAAARHEDETIGLTLSDLTYEVRRYFQKTADDPGLIISRIEMGSRASVAGLKPYEIVTHINDEPLHSVKDFERLLEEHTDLRLNVERMHRTRIVRMTRPRDEPDDVEPSLVEEQPEAAGPAEPIEEDHGEAAPLD